MNENKRERKFLKGFKSIQSTIFVAVSALVLCLVVSLRPTVFHVVVHIIAVSCHFFVPPGVWFSAASRKACRPEYFLPQHFYRTCILYYGTNPNFYAPLSIIFSNNIFYTASPKSTFNFFIQ